MWGYPGAQNCSEEIVSVRQRLRRQMRRVDANQRFLTPDRAKTERGWRRFGTTTVGQSCFRATTFPVRVQLAASSPALPPLFSDSAGPVLPKNRN
jgi:hypothetical protein